MAKTKDGDIVRLARKMERHRRAMYEIYLQIEESDHPGAAVVIEALRDNDLPPLAWATHCLDGLEHPERWQTLIDGSTDKDLGIKYKSRS
jgi:hypothetical protein